MPQTATRLRPADQRVASPGHRDQIRLRQWSDARSRPALGVLIIIAIALAWLALILAHAPARFVIVAPQARTGFEITVALGQLFGALVLFLFPGPHLPDRLRWAALGLATIGCGAIGYGYLLPLATPAHEIDVAIYAVLFVRTLGLGLIAVAFVPTRPIPLTAPFLLAYLSLGAIAGTAIAKWGALLPTLISPEGITALRSGATGVLPGVSGGFWALSLIPLALVASATAGALHRFPGRALGGWFAAALALQVAALLHATFWPSLYSSVLTTTSVFRAASALALVLGGVLELRILMDERTALLADEQARNRDLRDLAMRKADFTSIVAHELASPLSTIRAWADILDLDGVDSSMRSRATSTIRHEIEALEALVGDVQASNDLEHDRLRIDLGPVPVAALLSTGECVARAMCECHPFSIEASVEATVLADRQRIEQVLRNLLSNACKHTPPDTPILLRASRVPEGIRIEVADRGPGLMPEDRSRIGGKFERGSDRERLGVPGRGLGLYVSSLILQRHGAGLLIESGLAGGATFGFVLREAP